MTEMVERVARAIEPEAFDVGRFAMMTNVTTRVGDFERGQGWAREKALRAIVELRVPTVAMLAAGEAAFAGTGDLKASPLLRAWLAMIEVAIGIDIAAIERAMDEDIAAEERAGR